MAKRKASEPQPATTESFEVSLTELQSIVSELEDGSLGLEASLARFERGVELLRMCHVTLESAEQKVELLTRVNETSPTSAEVAGNAASSNRVESSTTEVISAEATSANVDLSFEEPSLF